MASRSKESARSASPSPSLLARGIGPRLSSRFDTTAPPFLGQTGLVEVDRVPALHQGRGDEDRVDSHHAGAADAHEQRPEGGVVRQLTDGFRRLVLGERRRGGTADRLRAIAQFDGHEGGAVALDAGVVQVAGRLVNLGLAAVLGLQRRDGQAIRLRRAVAATLADGRVDVDPLLRRLLDSALALAPFLGRALLVVDDGRRALDRPQFPEDLVVVTTVPDLDPAVVPVGEALQVLGHQDDPLHALELKLPGDAHRTEQPDQRPDLPSWRRPSCRGCGTSCGGRPRCRPRSPCWRSGRRCRRRRSGTRAPAR